jgi:hypothetical protein
MEMWEKREKGEKRGRKSGKGEKRGMGERRKSEINRKGNRGGGKGEALTDAAFQDEINKKQIKNERGRNSFRLEFAWQGCASSRRNYTLCNEI